jgi:dipeptidase
MCDSVVAVGSETSDGATLFAKNSDRKPLECQPFVQHAAAHHPPRARVRCTHIEIPQVAETYRVMGHSPDWVWGFEHGVNEHGVAIGNHTIFSKEPIEQTRGLIGMDLVRLGLERGRDAREALEVIATLIESHGMGGPALACDGAGYHNSFALADPTSAWVLEASNRRWAARRVERRACSNHMSIGADWEIASRDLENFARCEGWWREDSRVDVARAYRNRNIPDHITSGRHRQAQAWIDARKGRLDVASLKALLRDHGDGGAAWSRPDATPDEECFFTVCAHSDPVHVTTASLVTALPAERPGPWPVWISFGTPCSGMFLPVYLDGVIPAALARDGSDGAWSRFKRLHDAVAGDPTRRTPRVRESLAELEAEIETERLAVERTARSAAVSRDLDYAADIVTRFMDRSVDSALARIDELSATLADD